MRNTIPITAQLVEQRLEHRVADETAAAGRHSRRYQGLCGQLFIAAPLAAPPGPPCPACAAVLVSASPATVPAVPHQSRRRQRWFRRQPAAPVTATGPGGDR